MDSMETVVAVWILRRSQWSVIQRILCGWTTFVDEVAQEIPGTTGNHWEPWRDRLNIDTFFERQLTRSKICEETKVDLVPQEIWGPNPLIQIIAAHPPVEWAGITQKLGAGPI